MSVVLTGGRAGVACPYWYASRYDSFTATSCSVTILLKDWLGNETPTWLPDDAPVMCYIYRRVPNYDDIPPGEVYHYYKKFCTPVITGAMSKGSTTGQYVLTYSHPGAGQYTFFAVMVGYDIVDMT